MKIGKREIGKWQQERARSRAFPLSRFPAFRFASRQVNAFTLIELMTVIVIIGIMTALIIPEMRGTYEDALLRSSSRELVSVFELASSRAISLNQMHRVQLNTSTGEYLVERRIRSGSQEEFLPLKDVSGCTGILDKRIVIEVQRPEELAVDSMPEAGSPEAQPIQSSAEIFSFYPDGTADAALVTLKDRDGFRLGLRLNSTTARVHVFELERQ